MPTSYLCTLFSISLKPFTLSQLLLQHSHLLFTTHILPTPLTSYRINVLLLSLLFVSLLPTPPFKPLPTHPIIVPLPTISLHRSVVHHYGPNTGRIVLLVSLLSAGQFISCSAFLPSSFCACTTMLAYAGWLEGNDALAVAGVGAGALLGWPFAAVLGLV